MYRRILFLSFFFFSFFLTLAPSSVSAALIPCGRSGSDATAAEKAPCTICHIIVGGSNLITWGMSVMTTIAIVVIVAMAIFYIISAGDEGMMSTAKGGIKAAFIGFAVMLSAWLIVMTVLRVTSATITGLGITATGFTFTCDTTSTTVGTTGAGGVVAGAAGTGATGGTVTGGAACVDPISEQQRMASGGTVCNSTGSCPSCNTGAFDAFITSYGNAKSIPLSFIRGLIARESSCNPASVKTESNGTQSCGLMQVNTNSSPYTCAQLQDPETGIKEGVRILKNAFTSAQGLQSQYGSTVTVKELAAAIHNAGAGQSASSVDCSSSTGWPTIPKWGCPINPGLAAFNACSIKSYACNVGAC